MDNCRKIALLLILLGLFGKTYAQKLSQEVLYSTNVKDSIAYHVWLPDNWNSNQKYPVILMYNYGAANDNLLASTVNYFANHLRMIPNSIVVNVMVNMNQIGYNYETGDITKAGKNLISCLKEEIFPVLHKKYNASTYVSYIGQSYAASYGNYLFLNEPKLFSAYVIIAPEKLGIGQPGFELNNQLIRFYRENPRSYYLATGENDIERRINYAKEIAKKTTGLDTVSFKFKYTHFIGADHNTLFAYALPNALAFLFEPYNKFLENDSKLSAYQNLVSIENHLSEYYGINLERNFKNYNSFLQDATGKKDTCSLITIVKYFENQQSKGQDLRNFAYFFRINGLISMSYAYYQKAIKKIQDNEINTKAGHQALVTCYRELALNFYQNEPIKSWDLLQKALNDPYIYDPNMKYDLGKFSVDHKYKVEEGLNYLLGFAEDRANLVDIINLPYSRINLLIAKAYFAQNNVKKSKEYAQMVLKDDPKNTEALILLGK
ncbi:alpha/beta hydrolase-fold protein [Pedobacter punctiformis]|uniref:Alpha/beta hydrolase-fold protein n=1 Tax=Pedobacter punctiformis TaxID=3004097 RepID=A0ABT4L9W8_9SPHI|nr:alpha/beta hydrolase-fold protein [Pedobacter sp. HCMS5-2]MCZ4243599.1 alpha/beta hydrolase-fold protein [Pedobacter sp. HCMS5-2]